MTSERCYFKKSIHCAVNWILPKCKESNPIHISLWLILFGAFTAIVYFFATYFPFFYFLGIVLIFIRLVTEKLDEQVAITYQKNSIRAQLFNLISPELADILLMIGIIMADFDYMGVGIVAMGVCWAMILFDLAGLLSDHEIKRKGPMQEPYRVLTLIVASMLQFFAQTFHWPVDFIYIFLVWIIIGGLITILLRWRHLFKSPT